MVRYDQLLLMLSAGLGFHYYTSMCGYEWRKEMAEAAYNSVQSLPISPSRSLHAVPDLTLKREAGRTDGFHDLEDNDDEARPSGDGRHKSEGSLPCLEGSSKGDSVFLSPKDSAAAFLADGNPRCDFHHVAASDEREGTRRGLCLPTLFFMGVSKCGTTSLANWISRHPRTRWVRRPGHLYYLEAHVFDVPADTDAWRRSARPRSSSLRHRLAIEAEDQDTVIDYTPHYSLVAEVPFRISEFYGHGSLRRHGLKLLVVLREPVARTISSWKYKTDPGVTARVAKSKHPEALLASLAGQGIETRPLKQASEEGMEMASRLSACVANATASGGFGCGHQVTSCETSVAMARAEGCEKGQGDSNSDDEGFGMIREDGSRQGQEDCKQAICQSHVEPECNPRRFLEHDLYDAHVGKSMYALQLARWFAIFGRDKFKVIFTEDMAADPFGTLEGVLDFLGLDLVDANETQGLPNREEWLSIVSNRSNEADPEKTALLAPQVTPEIRKVLRDFFAPHNKALEGLLGVPLPPSWQT